MDNQYPIPNPNMVDGSDAEKASFLHCFRGFVHVRFMKVLMVLMSVNPYVRNNGGGKRCFRGKAAFNFRYMNTIL